VRVRVVALDRRFQNSSSGADRSFTLVQGPPVPLAVVSRKLHNSVPYDIDLPLNGSGVESRAGAGSHQVIFTFPGAVSVSSATVEGSGAVDSFTTNGSTVAVNVSGVADAQMITIRLNGVNNGATSGDVTLRMGTLIGDRNGDRTVNVSDALQTRNQSGQATDGSNFRSDMNADGVVNSGDTTIVRSRSGAFLAQ